MVLLNSLFGMQVIGKKQRLLVIMVIIIFHLVIHIMYVLAAIHNFINRDSLWHDFYLCLFFPWITQRSCGVFTTIYPHISVLSICRIAILISALQRSSVFSQIILIINIYDAILSRDCLLMMYVFLTKLFLTNVNITRLLWELIFSFTSSYFV